MRWMVIAALWCLVGPALGQPMTVQPIPGALTNPVYVTAPPGDTVRAFVIQKDGVIRILSLASDTFLAAPFLTIPNVNTIGECGLLGLAFDAKDGHKRITRGKNFLLAGGSEQTHLFMRETIIKISERLDERGQRLADVSVEELRELLDEVQE